MKNIIVTKLLLVVLVGLCSAMPAILYAQGETETENEITVEGVVTSGDTGEPLPGVNILIEGTETGTNTDIDGFYSLDVPSSDAVLIFTFLGYDNQEISVDGRTTIDVIMEPETIEGEEIVVVGYGSQRRTEITGSVSSVPPQRLAELPNNNVAQALQGSVAGLNIRTTSSGAEQNSQSILLRGRNSITASNSPLIVVDGIPFSGSISDINTQDVESMEVLKDASAAAIYGSRGSNGVILITTKKGQGEPKISYQGSYGIQKIAHLPPILSGPEFYEFKQTREPGAITNSEEQVYQSGEWVDWIDLATQTGQRQDHRLQVSGGTEAVSYLVSGSALFVEGIAIDDEFQRYNINTNVEAHITDWLTAGTRSQLSLLSRDGISPSFGSDSGPFYMNPLTRAYNDDGSLTIYPWADDPYFANPLARGLIKNDDKTYSIFSSNFVEVDFPFIPGLSYRLNAGIQYENDTNRVYYGRNIKQGLEAQGIAGTDDVVSNDYVIENLLTYDQTFGRHSVFLTGLYSWQEQRFESHSLDGEGFPNDVLTYYQMDVAKLLESYSDYGKEVLLSQMIRLNYSYDQRYSITLTGRRDGFSGFGDNNKYGIFPSAGIAWNIDNESFYGIQSIPTLRVRASYGKSGNQAVGPFETLSRLQNRSYLFDGNTSPGYVPYQLGNPDLGWETTTTLNIGMDLGLLNDRITITADAYNSNTEDLLLQRRISSIHGISTITQNIGKTKNKGIDLSITSLNILTQDVSWRTGLNLSMNRNEIVELVGEQDDELNEWFIGEPILVNYGYQYDGVWQQGDDIANSAQPDAEPGWAKIKDVNNDGVIDSNDRVLQGQRDPKFTWGLDNTIRWKNLSLYAFIQGVHGVERFNPLLSDNVFGEVRRNTIEKNWWTPQNPTNEFYANDSHANQLGVNILEDASFIRLKDVSLSWTVTDLIGTKIGLSSMRVYLSARNLFTITDWTGLDPELSSQRSIPLQREFTFGLNFSL